MFDGRFERYILISRQAAAVGKSHTGPKPTQGLSVKPGGAEVDMAGHAFAIIAAPRTPSSGNPPESPNDMYQLVLSRLLRR
jgi:hypothetical protein